MRDENRYSDQCDDGDVAAVVQHEGYEEADGEGGSGSDEPATDDAQNACDAVDGGVTSPCTVGERRTHCYHEGDVGGRERQFQRRSQGDEQTGEDEVDRGADEVESGSVGYDGFVLRKRELIHRFVLSGMMREVPLASVMLKRTSVRAIGVLPKFSSPSS